MTEEAPTTPQKAKNEKLRLLLNISFQIILLVAICAIIFTTITIYKYRDMLNNPMGYNMEQFGLSYCTCYDTQFRTVPIKSNLFNDSYEDLVPKQKYSPLDINLTGFEEALR